MLSNGRMNQMSFLLSPKFFFKKCFPCVPECLYIYVHHVHALLVRLANSYSSLKTLGDSPHP